MSTSSEDQDHSMTPPDQEAEHQTSENGISPDSHSHIVKRNRSQLACNLCRHSKLKCDRAQPCSQCTRRGREELCVYAKPVEKKKAQRSKNNMQNRLKHLESLVVSMMKEKEQTRMDGETNGHPVITPESSAPSVESNNEDSIFSGNSVMSSNAPAAPLGSTLGQVIVGKTETTYIGATHWAAILDDIEEVKTYFQEDEEEDESADNYPSSFVFGSIPYGSRADILASLPERSVVDRLVYSYFNSDDHAKMTIHKPTFQKEYRKFWLEPSKAPLKWISLLCSMMSLSTYIKYRSGEAPIETRGTPLELIATYRAIASQALILGNYTKPGPYTIEALFFYLQTEFLRSTDLPISVWMISGILVRMALRMGYHRDSKHRPSISVFEGEMRRRLWFIIVTTELLLSFHVGLPSMIRTIQADTCPPSNLRDEDFGPESVVLPPPRSLEEKTVMSYGIAKTRIAGVFGIIAEQSNSTTLPSYAAVREVDNMLLEALNVTPEWLKLKPLSQSITEQPDVIKHSFNLSHLFHKSRCVLHRRWLLMAQIDKRYAFSRRVALESAMALLQNQKDLDDAGKPGGPLEKERWYGSGLLIHDFLLAAMIICLTLRHGMSRFDPETTTEAEKETEQQEMLEALQGSYRIWKDMTTFGDSGKAASVLAAMLRKLQSRIKDPALRAEIMSHQTNGKPLRLTASFPCGPNIGGIKAIKAMRDHDALHGNQQPTQQINADIPIQQPMTNGDFMANIDPNTTFGDLEAMIDMPSDLDWGMWDHQVTGATHPYGAEYAPDMQDWPADLNLNVDLQDLDIMQPGQTLQQPSQNQDFMDL